MKFVTNDTKLASAIVTRGFSVDSIEKREGGRVFFSFQEDERLKQTVKRYWAKTLQNDSYTLLSEFKNLKHRIAAI